MFLEQQVENLSVSEGASFETLMRSLDFERKRNSELQR